MKAVHRKGSFGGSGGLDLFYQSWEPASRTKADRSDVPVMVFIHGMAEHSDRYEFPITYFISRGFTVYAMDLRGHGNSGGKRSYAESLDELLEDIDRFLDRVKMEQSGRKLFLVGHSFGGQLVLNYGARHPGEIDGIIVSSPNIRLKMRLPIVKRLIAPVLSKLLPTLALGNEIDPALVSKDEKVVRAYRQDKMIQKKITTRLADIVLENQLNIMDLAPKYRVPTLFMHAGDDCICSPEGTEEFYRKAAARDKELRIYDGFYHELFNEVGREMVFRDMEKWIDQRA